MTNISRLDASNVIVTITTEHHQGAAAPCVMVNVVANTNVIPVDRDFIYGWSVGLEGAKGVGLRAVRLSNAVLSGLLFKNVSIKTDVNGKTYVSADGTAVMGRRMDADLRRMGF